MAQENKDVIRRYFDEIWTKGNLMNVIDELITVDFLFHGITASELRGPEVLKPYITKKHSACPDIHLTIEDLQYTGQQHHTHYRQQVGRGLGLLGSPRLA